MLSIMQRAWAGMVGIEPGCEQEGYKQAASCLWPRTQKPLNLTSTRRTNCNVTEAHKGRALRQIGFLSLCEHIGGAGLALPVCWNTAISTHHYHHQIINPPNPGLNMKNKKHHQRWQSTVDNLSHFGAIIIVLLSPFDRMIAEKSSQNLV